MLKNTKNSYGSLSKFFHWGIFLLLVIQFYLVLAPFPFEDLVHPIFLHKSIGVVLLILGIFFIAWRSCNIKPTLEKEARWKKTLAIAMHHSLLTLLILLPILGYGLSCTAGRPINFFGLGVLPCVLNKNETLNNLFFQCHQKLGFLFAGLIVLHILAALHHHLIIKDNILKRMLSFNKK